MKWNWRKAPLLVPIIFWIVGCCGLWFHLFRYNQQIVVTSALVSAQGVTDFAALKEADIHATILRSVTPQLLQEAKAHNVTVILEITDSNAQYAELVDAIWFGPESATSKKADRAQRVTVRDYQFTEREENFARSARFHGKSVYRGHWVSPADLTNFSDADLVARFERAVRERNCDLIVLPDWPIERLASLREQLNGIGSAKELRGKRWPESSSISLESILWNSIAITGLFLFIPGFAMYCLSRQAMWIALSCYFGAMQVFILLWKFADSLLIQRSWLPNLLPTISVLFLGATMARSAFRRLPEADGATLFAVLTAFTLAATNSVELATEAAMAVRGVKALFLLPIGAAVVTAIFIAFRDGWKPKFWEVALLATIAPICWYMIVRSGNDPIGGVSSTEWGLRAWFDQVFWVRPRFKEFAIGVPALVFLLAARRQADFPKGVTIFLVFLSSIGLASMVNTFLHPYADLKLSIVRTVTGLVLGSIIAVGALLVFRMIPWTRNWFQKANG